MAGADQPPPAPDRAGEPASAGPGAPPASPEADRQLSSVAISVAWVGAEDTVHVHPLTVPAGSRLGDVLAGLELPALAGLREALVAGRLVPAVFGELREPAYSLQPGDRIELLEGLRIDPKLARRRRVEVRRRAQAAGKPGRARG